jgi:hypothetical protein
MISRCLVLAVAILGTGGCATTGTSAVAVVGMKPDATQHQKERWELMVGHWYGDQPRKDGGRHQWLVVRSPYGWYKIDFVETGPNGKVDQRTEIGEWGLSGPVYFTSYRGWIEGSVLHGVGSSNPSYYDAYRILRLDKNKLEYKSFATGDHYVVKRVAPDFKIPLMDKTVL